MFESQEEMIAEEIYQNNITDITKHMIANAIQAACQVSRNVLSNTEAMGIPRSKAFDVACRLSFNVNSILTKYIDENNFSQITYDELNTGRGRPIVHYTSGGVIFHIKKESSPNKLPQDAKYRREETKKNEQILLLPDLPEEHPAHMIVTFNHREFYPQFIQIGMIAPNYERWIGRWSLIPYIQPEAVETMQKEYGEPLTQQAIELVHKNFRLEMRR